MHERIVHIKKKEKFVIRIFKKEIFSEASILIMRFFSMQEVSRKMIFSYYLRNFSDIIRPKKDDLSVVNKVTVYLA